MNFSTFTTKQDGSVLRVILSNPPINLLNMKMIEELFQLAGQLVMSQEITVVVMDSADPDFFIAHFDLNDMEASITDPSRSSKYPDINGLQSVALAWQSLPQVTIGKVSGRCRGGGLEFLMGLSMRFASNKSKFCLPEAASGFLAAGGGATRLAMALGPARALEFLLSARDFDGVEAERYGLVNRALPADELDAYVEDLIARISRRSAPVLAMHKETFSAVLSPFVDPLFAGFAVENKSLQSALKTEEFQSAVQAMMKHEQSRETELDLPETMVHTLSPTVATD